MPILRQKGVDLLFHIVVVGFCVLFKTLQTVLEKLDFKLKSALCVLLRFDSFFYLVQCFPLGVEKFSHDKLHLLLDLFFTLA
jgi:hypothetical protein